MSQYLVLFKNGLSLRYMSFIEAQPIAGQEWSALWLHGPPIQARLVSIKGDVKSGPADGLVEVCGQGRYHLSLDRVGFSFSTREEQRSYLALLEQNKWPIEEVHTWLSKLLPHWFKPKKRPVPEMFERRDVHVILPLTDIEIVWPQDR